MPHLDLRRRENHQEENDPEFQITDVKLKNFRGQAAQR